MTSRLVEEGWVAPDDAGPGRRFVVGMALISTALLTAWALGPGGLVHKLRGGDEPPRRVVVAVADDGTATIDGSPAEVEVRLTGTTRFLAIAGDLDGTRPVRVEVREPIGVEPELVAVRVARPRGDADVPELLVTMPAQPIAELSDARPAGPLRELTAPMDERIGELRRDERLQSRLEDGWWWLIPLGLLASVVLPAWLWRRSCRRMFSMRLPGPGRDIDSAPPSSLDPVGAAVLIGGARPADDAGAFAGHVLDLVERRQLRLRRNADPEAGPVGAQLGLAHADKEALPDDPAVAALRQIAGDDGLTVAVPDDVSRVRRIPAEDCRAWSQFVVGRARFERMVERFPVGRVAAGAVAVAAFAIVGLFAALTAQLDGERAAGWLVAAAAAPAAVVLVAWARDARRWRVVARARRTERAQWIAWRRAVGSDGGPSLDQRNLPVLAATGSMQGLVRETATRGAVALDAVTVGTVASLRAMCASSQ